MKKHPFLRFTALFFYMVALITLFVTIWYYRRVLLFTFERPSANQILVMGIAFSFMMAICGHMLLLVVKMAKAADTHATGAGKQVNASGKFRSTAIVFYIIAGLVLLCGACISWMTFSSEYGRVHINFLWPALTATITFAMVIAFAGHMLPLSADIAEGLAKRRQ